MVKITRDEVILDMAKVIVPLFEQKGFVQKKNIFEFHDSNTNNISIWNTSFEKKGLFFTIFTPKIIE